MKLKAPKNNNYCATVVQLSKFVELPNCNNVKGALIFGNQVIVGNDTKEGDTGLYFPIETKLSNQFLSENNLYRDNIKNVNQAEKGYFEDSGRIRAVKFRGNKSEGFFIPTSSLMPFVNIGDLVYLQKGDEFDEINGIPICEKYIPKNSRTPGLGGSKDRKLVKRISRLVEGQFRLHEDTAQLRKNVMQLNPYDIASITYKKHGTSFVVGNILTKKPLSKWKRFLKWTGLDIRDTLYDLIYSSRKVVKNEFETKDHMHYYGYDLWQDIKDTLVDKVQKGITLYGEAVGFTKDGGYIQKGYDYGCKPGEFKTYIYAITSTNEDGDVIRFTWQQVKDYCLKYDLDHALELQYGRLGDMVDTNKCVEEWHDCLLQMLTDAYLEKPCLLSKNKVPGEGIVLAVDHGFKHKAFKLKSYAFLEHETKMLDTGEVDIESQQSEEGAE